MATGNQTAMAVLRISERDMRQSLASVKEEVHRIAEPVLTRHGLPADTAEIFFDLASATRPALTSRLGGPTTLAQRQIDMCNRALERMQLTPSEATKQEILEALGDDFRQLRSNMAQARNTASQVATVLRPFNAKYLHSWQSDPRMADRLDQSGERIHQLNTSVVDSPDALYEWSAGVLAVFLQVVVWPDQPSFDKLDRPMFTIRESSERIYRIAWNSWIRNNQYAILNALGDEGFLVRESRPSRGISSLQSNLQNGWNLADSMAFAAPTATKASPASAEIVTSAAVTPAALKVAIASVADARLTTERSWTTLGQGIKELTNWLRSTAIVWQAQGHEVTIRLDINQADSQFSITLPNELIEEAAEAIALAVRRLTA